MNKKNVRANKKPSERSFSVELNSNDHIKLGSLNGSKTLIEGSIGQLVELNLIEGVFLEIKGTYGTLSVDLGKDELISFLNKALLNKKDLDQFVKSEQGRDK